MRILLTNNTLSQRAGSELYLYDVARALHDRGHLPVAFSTVLGEVAAQLRAISIPVVDDLNQLVDPPDLIHGQHHLETMTALLQFPNTPAVYFHHGPHPWEERPPRHPRIRRYVTTTAASRELVKSQAQVPLDRVDVVHNFVDLARFRPRSPLPARPLRALIFSNHARDTTHAPAVQQACTRAGIVCDVVGMAWGNPTAHPESVLPQYDLVFAIGRSALESMAVGAAVVLCDASGAGKLVTSREFEALRDVNFGKRALVDPLDWHHVLQQIQKYDARDAATVSTMVREQAGLEDALDRIERVYRSALDDFRAAGETIEPGDESRAAAAYLRWLNPHIKSMLAGGHSQDDLARREEELRRIYGTRAWRAMGMWWTTRDAIRRMVRRLR